MNESLITREGERSNFVFIGKLFGFEIKIGAAGGADLFKIAQTLNWPTTELRSFINEVI